MDGKKWSVLLVNFSQLMKHAGCVESFRLPLSHFLTSLGRVATEADQIFVGRNASSNFRILSCKSCKKAFAPCSCWKPSMVSSA
jgi:hypothetical protein